MDSQATRSEASRNIFVLSTAQALGAAGPPIVISLGGLVGAQLSSDPALVTLPVSLFNLGLAAGTLPAAMIMRQFGRRSGYLVGASCGLMAGLTAAFGIWTASFLLFCLGTFIAGFYAAYVQSYRFAATDSVSGDMRARAVSWVMVGGLFAAIIGPQLVIWTRDLVPGTPYVGSFLSQAALAILAVPVLLMLRSGKAGAAGGADAGGGRPLMEIIMSPGYLLAVATGVVSYGLMTFVMTASPIAMVGHGHSIDHAAMGIQWHILAMFGPSFVTGSLIARFGKERIAAIGLLLIGSSGAVALSGLEIGHFWIGLILLGVGWNFGFIAATAMVTECHTPAERTRAQGANDFIIFGTVAGASFFAGSLLHSSGWEMINWAIFPVITVMLAAILWQSTRKKKVQPGF